MTLAGEPYDIAQTHAQCPEDSRPGYLDSEERKRSGRSDEFARSVLGQMQKPWTAESAVDCCARSRVFPAASGPMAA
jgi:hypothetical protein